MRSNKRKTIIMEADKDLFKEMLNKQEQILSNILSNGPDLIKKTLYKLTVEIKERDNSLKKTLKEIDELKLSLEVYQDINDNKIKNLEESTNRMNETHRTKIENHNKEYHEIKEKLCELENDSWRYSFRFDGISEYNNKIWADT